MFTNQRTPAERGSRPLPGAYLIPSVLLVVADLQRRFSLDIPLSQVLGIYEHNLYYRRFVNHNAVSLLSLTHNHSAAILPVRKSKFLCFFKRLFRIEFGLPSKLAELNIPNLLPSLLPAENICSWSSPMVSSFSARHQGPRKQINPQSCLSFGPPSALHQKSHIDNMLPLARLEGEPKSVAIFAYLFIPATLRSKRPWNQTWSDCGVSTTNFSSTFQ